MTGSWMGNCGRQPNAKVPCWLSSSFITRQLSHKCWQVVAVMARASVEEEDCSS